MPILRLTGLDTTAGRLMVGPRTRWMQNSGGGLITRSQGNQVQWPHQLNLLRPLYPVLPLHHLEEILALKRTSGSEKKNRPTLERATKQERPPLRLTQRDLEIIKAVYLYRALTTPQIEALLFPS